MGFHDEERGLNALRRALAEVLQNGLDPEPIPVTIHAAPGRPARGLDVPWLLTQTSQSATASTAQSGTHDDAALATSSAADEAEGTRLIALVELARKR